MKTNLDEYKFFNNVINYFCELAKPMLKNQYGQYLLKVIDEMKSEINSRTLSDKFE